MVERRQHTRFALKARDTVGIGDKVRRQHLDRDIASELGVARTVDLAHSARTQAADDLVHAETLSDRQRLPLAGEDARRHGSQGLREEPLPALLARE
jgi:hypothetical protein